MIMIRNIYTENIIDLTSLHRLSQYILGNVIVIGCVSMVIEMNKAMQKLCRQWIESGIKNPPNHRIGINSGHCKVGNIGTDTKLDYTVMGNAVNLASYLESVANTNEILLSEKNLSIGS